MLDIHCGWHTLAKQAAVMEKFHVTGTNFMSTIGEELRLLVHRYTSRGGFGHSHTGLENDSFLVEPSEKTVALAENLTTV